MDIQTKLALLDQVYRLYDEVVDTKTLACQRYCSDCCTRNVALTTLESYRIVDHLIGNDQIELLQKLLLASTQQRFQPRTTTNRLSELCMTAEDLPIKPILKSLQVIKVS